MLVSIGVFAFSEFPGRIQFTDQPFPKLQTIGSYAFRDVLGTLSRIELIDQRELNTVNEHAFRGYQGSLSMTGDMPKLDTIGYAAFHSAGKRADAEQVEQVVSLKDLPVLRRVIQSAFNGFGGKLTFDGRFPKLEHIGERAFYGLTGDVSFKLLFGAPALQCMGPEAFSATSWTRNMVLKGEFPCLLHDEHKNGGTFFKATNFNAGAAIFKDFRKVSIFPFSNAIKAGVKNCSPDMRGWCYETTASCTALQGFASRSQCAFADR